MGYVKTAIVSGVVALILIALNNYGIIPGIKNQIDMPTGE
jgi:hypothetical protein